MKWTRKGHEFDAVGHLLHGKKNAFLYGAGVLGLELRDLLLGLRKHLDWNVVLVDGDKNKQADGARGIPCLSPKELEKADKQSGFVIICALDENSREIARTVEGMGWRLMTNAFEYQYFLFKQLSVHFMYSLDKVYFSSLNVVPSTACNLNCRGCLNFNPYIEKHTIHPLEALKADCAALFSAIDAIGRFQITGGEPLLYDQIVELIRHIGGEYREKIVRLEMVTNGTIVPTDKLCEALRANRVFVFLDDYRKTVEKASRNYPLIVEKFQRFGVRFAENTVSRWISLTPDLLRETTVSEQALIERYAKCDCPWATLENNAVSACNYALYSEKAGLTTRDAREYFDLAAVNASNRRELMEFRLRCNEKGYVELCGRCDGFNGGLNEAWTLIEPATQIPRRSESLQ